ncbi:barley B recombinant-like protein D isoform X2 [Amborella trichopoda]|nr:barley B recombinant-like protein D isoform X2 [Amborella trichopoda]|eukprot:XP_020522701.1 barley B recombinant-like protein D isoform X2 [Amborella trichopoda]
MDIGLVKASFGPLAKSQNQNFFRMPEEHSFTSILPSHNVDGTGKDRKQLCNLIGNTSLEDRGLKEFASSRMTTVKAERDAAVRERDMAIAEKKAATSERDSAFNQRDMALAQREEAVMERDAALAALESLKRDHPDWHAYVAQLAHIFSSTQLGSCVREARVDQPIENYAYNSNRADGQMGLSGPSQPVVAPTDGSNPDMGPTKNGEKRKGGAWDGKKPGRRNSATNPAKKRKPAAEKKVGIAQQNPKPTGQKRRERGSSLHKSLSMPVPYCSCTGANHICHRWGDGGWQSACCTPVMSVYPLPMNPYKKGYRLTGRKMSGGAFQKVLQRLGQQGVDVTKPIDLKDHWAKHGSNKYVMIK